jgi:hypothetical protein
MRIKKNLTAIVICIIAVVALITIAYEIIRYNFIYTETMELIWIPTSTPQDQIDIYTEEGKNAYINEDESKIYVETTKKGWKEWLEYTESDLRSNLKSANNIPRLTMSVTDDYKEIDIEMGSDVSYTSMMNCLVLTMYYTELLQQFNGVEDTWSVDIVLRDIDTGNIILKVNYPHETIRIEQSLWDNQLNNALEET